MPLFELVERPDLDAPVLVLALDGWIDAGIGAANARTALLTMIDTTLVASFDADELLDHRARRPTMHLDDGVMQRLTWPTIELRAGSDLEGNDVVLLVGAEPDHRWQAFSHAAVDLALELGVRLVVGLGAYPAPVPHTRPTRIATTASDPSLARFAAVRSTIDVPSGINAAIEWRAHELGIPAVGLWAQVPHYVAAMPYPAASAALVEALALAGELKLDAAPLHEEAALARQRLDSLVEQNPEHVQMVRQLEAAYDNEITVTDVGGPVSSVPPTSVTVISLS